MAQVLTNVPLLSGAVEMGPKADSMDSSVNGETTVSRDSRSSEIQDVLRVCAEQGLEHEMESICKVSWCCIGPARLDPSTLTLIHAQTYAEVLLSEKRYGEAIAFCMRARDQKRIARIADRVLAEYIQDGQSGSVRDLTTCGLKCRCSPGPEAFIRHVDSIPTSLLRPSGPSIREDVFGEQSHSEDEDENLALRVPTMPLGIHSSRLNFIARYRDFFALYARGERRQAAALLVLLLTSNTAPKAFSAVSPALLGQAGA